MTDAPQVDFSEIRGDWQFHLDYLANAIQQTLIRARSLWQQVSAEAGEPAIGELLDRVAAAWEQLNASGGLAIDEPLLDEFISLCASSKAPCDALEEAKGLCGSTSIYDTPLEQFTEALRELRSFGDDLVMMREQKP